MSGLVAVFNRTGAPVDPAVIQAMLAASPHRAIDGQDCWISGPVALAHQHFWVTPEEVGEKQPLVAEGLASGRLVVTFDGRLDNRQELLRALKLVAPEQQWSDVALVLQSYQRWGEGCAERLLGDFNVTWTKTLEQSMKMVALKRVDVSVDPEPVMRYFMNKLGYADRLRVLSGVLDKVDFNLLVRKDSWFRSKMAGFDETIRKMRLDGAVKKIQDSYLIS